MSIHITNASYRRANQTKHKLFYGTLIIPQRKYGEESAGTSSRYQALKATRRILKDSYTPGGRYYQKALEQNPIED